MFIMEDYGKLYPRAKLQEFLSLWKGRLAFKIYIQTKRERYGIKSYMVLLSKLGRGRITVYTKQIV